MRYLKFIVEGESITLDPACDLSGLFPGSEEEVKAEFVFSPEWKSRVKVVAFWSVMGKEYPPQAINEDNTCQIPTEVLAKVAFKVQILGKRKGGNIVRTNTITVYQSGHK